MTRLETRHLNLHPRPICHNPATQNHQRGSRHCRQFCLWHRVPSYSLEALPGDCRCSASICRQVVEVAAQRSLGGLPLDGFDYDSILGQCCKTPVGYVQIYVGFAGLLVLDGRELSVPMATTEGCLVASTNQGLFL